MTKKQNTKTIFLLSLLLSFLIIIASCVGLFTPNFYAAETLNWQAQSVGQDMIDLFLITPCLLITSVLAYNNNKTAALIWGGVVLYLTYTFTLFCFDVHFNKLFLIYCICLGLSFYLTLYFIFTQHQAIIKINLEHKSAIRFTGIYFLIISVLFYVLWLAEIIPASIQNSPPKSLTETGLLTNGVHVLDLSVILPGIFITGIFLLKRISLGFVLTPIILTFFILMDITIGMLALVMDMKGVESNLMLTAIMFALALVSLAMLVWYLKSMKTILTL